jgi:O-antigen/teichoic acid export membrane protein
MKQHYGLAAVRSSLAHFLLGKAVSAISSLVALLLAARALGVPQFAAYAVFQAVVNIAGMLTSFGVGQTVIRYVPELRATNNNLPMYRLIITGTLTRAGVLAVTMCLIYLALPWLAPLINMQDWLPWLGAYLVVGWFRQMNMFICRVLEGLLWQRLTQYSQALGSLSRLSVIGWFAFRNQLDLTTLIAAELIGEVLILTIVLAGFVRLWRADDQRNEGDHDWFPENRVRMRRYSLWGYLQSLSNLLYGGAPNRILASVLLRSADVGLLGFIDNLAEYGRRFMPSQMLQGMIRPLFIARYSKTGDFHELGAMANLTFRISLLALAPAAVVLLVGGPTILAWFTNGKYTEAAYLLAGTLFVLSLESLRSQVELLTQSVERNEIFLVSNLALSGSLLLSMVLLPLIGLWAFVIGASVGNIVSLLVVKTLLKKQGFVFELELWLAFKGLMAVVVAGFGGMYLGGSMALWQGLSVALLAYGLITLLWPPFKPAELKLITGLIRGRAHTNKAVPDSL